MVGLFVSLGIVITVVAIIWVGATKYFEKGNRYVTYFDESVQGLQKDSTVKYRGVEVGRVEQITVAPDNRLIGVVMKIDLRDDLPRTTVAQLKVAGITGMVFVELDRRKAEEPDQSPKLTFPTEYPVIGSRPSELARIMSGVNVAVEKLNQIDAQEISDQLKATAAEIQNFFRGEKMTAILANVESSSANLKTLSAKVDTMMAGGGRVDEVLVETRDALKGTRGLILKINEELTDLNLKRAVGKTRDIAGEMKATSENLRQASESLEAFLNRINDRPSDLIFGKPPKGRFNE